MKSNMLHLRQAILCFVFLFGMIGGDWGQTTYDWYDSSPDGNWKQGAAGARWTGGLWDEPGFGIVRFNNNHQLTMTNNVTGIYSQHSIIFGSSNTSNRTIGGNTVRFYDNSGTDPKIENQSSGSHTINFNIEGDGATDPLEMNPTSGNLTFGGTVNNQGTDIFVFGNNGNTITYNGVISGAGKFILKQNSKAVFNAINTYTGNTELDAGELWIGGADRISNSSKLVLNGGTFRSGATTGNSETMGTIQLTANSTIALGTGSHTLTFSASNGEAWTAGRTLTITGWTGTAGATGTAGKIFVGSSDSGLQLTQLAQISFTGYGAATILSTGEVVPTSTLYRSATSGNWNSAATWESSADGLTWSAAGSTPTSSDGTITIRNGHTVTITAGVSIDQVTVDNGGIVIHSGAGTVTLADGTGTDLTITGTWRRTVSSHTISISSGATISVGSTGIYEHELAAGGGSIPTATWNSTSILRIKNNTSSSSALTNLAQTFGIVEVNTSTHTDAFVLDGITDVTNEFRIIQTGTGLIYTTSNWTITGSIVQSGGKFTNNFNNSASTTTICGGLTISGGTFEVSNSGGSAIHSLIVNGNVLVNGGSLEVNKSALTAGRLYVKGNLTLSSGSIVFTQGGTTGSSGIYYDGSGAQTFTHSGGTLSTATGGIGRRFYYKTTSGPTALNETYSSSSAQSTISGSEGTAAAGYATWPTGSLINGFTVSNSAGVTLSTSKLITGTLTLSSGSLNLGGNTLTLNSGSSAQSITGSGSNAFNVTNGTISLTGSGAHTKTLSNFGTTSSGGLTLGSDVTLQMNSNAALDCGGNGTSTSLLTVLGTMQMNSATNSNVASSKPPFYGNSSTLEYKVSYGVADEWKSGTAITTPGVPQNVTINGSSIIVTSPTSERNVKGNLLISVGNFTLNSSVGGDLKVAGNITNNATFTHNNRAVYLNGSNAQSLNGTLNGTTTTNCFPYLFLDNTSGGVTLNTPVNVSNTLTLTTGVVTTTSTNILHILNTSASAMSGGSSTSYINGPLRWSVSNGSGGNYKFHVGKSATYLPLNVNNPTGTSPVITAEAIVANAGGSAGSGLASLSSSEYWSIVNTGSLSAATISLAKASIGSNDGIGSSTTLAGSYTNLGGSVTSTLIASNTVTAGTTVGSLATNTYFVLGVKVAAPTISSFSPSTVYVGTTITITGTNFTNASAVSIGGVAASSYTVISATSISAVVAASATSGTISVTTPGGTATSSSSFTFSGYVSTAASDWNTTSTWLGGALPTASSAVTIDHAITVNGTVANAPSSVTINNTKSLTFGAIGALTATTVTNNGSLVMTAGGTLTIASGGTLANGTNTFTYGTGTVAFSGTGTISGTIGFNHVNIAGGVNFGAASTINGTLSINTGGYVSTNAPIYASGSTLKYNSGGTYGRGTEWSAASAAGYPHHVQISTGTILDLGANSGTATTRQIAGNMTVDNGTTLSMALNPMTATLTVKGNYFNYGTTILSSSSGGDLVLEGNLTDNATFTANGRAIFFQGSNTQSIYSSDNPLDIDVARFNKTGGEVLLLQNLLIDETADPVQFAGTSILNLNGNTATFGKTGTTSSITMNSTSAIKGSANSHLTIYGNEAFGTINFDQTTPGTSNQLGNLLIQRSSGSLTLGNAVSINGSLTLSSGKLIIGANTLTLAGTVASMNETNCLVGSSTSNLTVNGTGTLGTLYFDQTTPGTTNYLNTFNLNRTSSGTMNLANNLQLASLTITNGEFIINASKQLTVNGLLTNNGILTLNSGATLVQGTSSTLAGSGTYNVKQTITGAGTSTPTGRFWYVGSPVSGATSAVYDAAGSNILKYYDEPNNTWQEITDNNAALAVGKGYFVQATAGTTELNFTVGNINNGSYTLNATRNTTTNAFRGYNLLTNPYPSYLDWDNVSRSSVGSTMWYRVANSVGTMVFDTYNAPAGTGTNNNGAGAVTKFIPPMQSFWVNVPQGQTTGTVSFGNSQRSHYSTGVQGLRSTAQDFPAFLRLNLLDGSFVDQTILYMKPDANNTFDEYDSEKMFLGGVVQFYSTVNAKKLVLNGMKNQKAKTSVPLTLEMPSSKSYTFQAEEFNIEDGLILLEDKQEGVIQDLTINPTYTFFGNAGTNTTRFVVHFQLAGAPVLVGGPMELESLGSEELTTDNIQIISNNQGTVIIHLDEGFKPEGSIRIFDASGRLVEQTDFNDQETTIHLNEQAGMYFVEVSAGKLMMKKKIVIN